MGTKELDMKKAFKLAIRSLLTPCSKQEFCQAFPNFTIAEQEHLHRLFIQVIASLHGNLEDEFQSACLETQVGTVLDTVEQLVEEQAMDPLSSYKYLPDSVKMTNLLDVARDLSTIKKDEIQNLTQRLGMAKEQSHHLRERIQLLKKERVDLSGLENAVEKLRSGSLLYGNVGQ